MSSDATKPSRQDQAAAWFAAERAGMMLVEQRAEFDAWRADPRNQAALDAMRELWDDLAILKGQAPAPKRAPVRRRMAPIAAAIIALLIGSVALITLLLSSADTPIVTANGQQQTRSMPDGSVLAVNVASAVSYKFTEARRTVKLSDGEAAFLVKPDAKRPFVVRVGDIAVRAVGTSFNVRQREGIIQIAVSDGKVELCRVAASGEEVVFANLNAGELLQLPRNLPQVLPAAIPVPIPPAQVAEWRMRVVTYEDVSVRAVLDDFNRYFERKVRVNATELQNRRITIRLQVDNRERGIETLAALLDAKITQGQNEDLLSY